MIELFPTVFIIDDDEAIRDALSLMIEQERIQVQSYPNAKAFLENYKKNTYGCAIIDIRMPEMDGMELQKKLLEDEIFLPVIFLTGHGDIPTSVKAMKAGALDFLTKPVTREKLMASIYAALEKSKAILEEMKLNRDAKARFKDLTDREREVMLLAIQGLPNKNIARQLGISHRTVEIHKSKIMQKSGATNLLDLARIAHESGIF